VDIKTIQAIATSLPPHIAILMRGPTGIGKSMVARGIADGVGLPFIDVRGSTLDESKVGGLPNMRAVDEKNVATFVVPSWFKRACEEPCVIMLDELNRSMPSVMQAFFQIVLDRELGNDEDGLPMALHPETRVIAAVNHGSEYDVNDMDPALLRRFWVADIDPNVSDWVDWANEFGLDSVLIDFVRQNPEHWRVDAGAVEPGTVVPTPASWHRLSDSLVHADIAPSKVAGNPPSTLYAISMGFLGTEAAISFVDFVKNYERQISAEDVLEGNISAEELAELQAGASNAVIDKLALHCKENNWNAKQSKHIAEFAKAAGGEMMVHLWNKISGCGNLKNVQKLHKLIGKEVVAAVQASRALQK
jgi:hypothetical protein